MIRFWNPERLPSLAHRDFRNFQLGSFVSNVGNRMQFFALLLHVYEKTNSSAYVGALGIVRAVPLVVFGLFGGVLADHVDRRIVLLISQIGMALTAVCLALATINGFDTVWVIYAIVAAGSVANAFNAPARQAMVANLVPAKDFPNAASINGITWRLSDVLGPVIAAAVIVAALHSTLSGFAWIYIINAVSFAALFWAIWKLPSRPPSATERARSFRETMAAIKQGLAAFRSFEIVRNTMIVDFWATFFAGAEALLPAFGAQLLLDKPTTALLGSAVGVGALAASVFTAFMPTMGRQGLWVLRMIALFGVSTILYGFSVNFWTAYVCLALIGATDMVSTVLRQTIRQLSTPDALRGRIGSIGSIFQISGPQLGDAEAGFAADGFGRLGLSPMLAVRASIWTGGIGSVLIALWWMWRSPLKNYDRHIEPEVAIS